MEVSPTGQHLVNVTKLADLERRNGQELVRTPRRLKVERIVRDHQRKFKNATSSRVQLTVGLQNGASLTPVTRRAVAAYKQESAAVQTQPQEKEEKIAKGCYKRLGRVTQMLVLSDNAW